MRKSYRGALPKPDKRGYVRPKIGDKRFTVGNVRHVGDAEMERRHDALRDLFDRQCECHNLDHWSAAILPYAEKIAKGDRLIFRVSEFAKDHVGQASEEAQHLQELRQLGLDISADDPTAIVRGEKEFQDLLRSKVREEVARAISKTDAYFDEFPSGLVQRLNSSTPSDETKLEVKTFYQAIDAYRSHRMATGKKQDNGNASPSVQNDLRISKRLKKEMSDFAIWETSDKNQLDELFAYWRNRPVSKKTGDRISDSHSKHTMNTLWSIFVFIDESSRWNWELPKGAGRIDRTPISLDSDRKKRRSRRISQSIYDPDQLALIAKNLDRLGKLILGVSVNCAMQPAEIGRLEVDDLYTAHPETNVKGDWVVFDRPKTHEYGEWKLWAEVAELAAWGRQRAITLGCDRLVVTETGQSWYREDWTHPATNFCDWWQESPANKNHKCGVVTKLSREVSGFPRYTIKYLRKILPTLVRPTYGNEIADLINARKVDRHGRVSGRDTDRYADRLYDEAAEAVLAQREHFRPFLDALKCD
ncbi:hypothetical protein [Fuerstiella marisgermanici]|uniref:Core-binding (CB) domain-containing protein n=1 Tax=Fuerstiella marisgermanici TaxID=1891926 RepID=A0A1P8WNT1_9PLAN|nr:hypothetical protein [Fuerstiella marisgermanici]APZ95724.1 hypothetical protein Fuma_05386 [Fuerstiella marisgermanici]